MLGWALTFLVVALIAAVLGFGGIAGFAVEIAKNHLRRCDHPVRYLRRRRPHSGPFADGSLSKLPHGFQARACSRPGLAGRELLLSLELMPDRREADQPRPPADRIARVV